MFLFFSFSPFSFFLSFLSFFCFVLFLRRENDFNRRFLKPFPSHGKSSCPSILLINVILTWLNSIFRASKYDKSLSTLSINVASPFKTISGHGKILDEESTSSRVSVIYFHRKTRRRIRAPSKWLVSNDYRNLGVVIILIGEERGSVENSNRHEQCITIVPLSLSVPFPFGSANRIKFNFHFARPFATLLLRCLVHSVPPPANQ